MSVICFVHSKEGESGPVALHSVPRTGDYIRFGINTMQVSSYVVGRVTFNQEGAQFPVELHVAKVD